MKNKIKYKFIHDNQVLTLPLILKYIKYKNKDKIYYKNYNVKRRRKSEIKKKRKQKK